MDAGKSSLSEDECREAQEDEEEEEEEEEEEVLNSLLSKVGGEKPHMLTNPLEIRAMGESPDLRNLSPDWEEDSPLQSIQDENLPQEFMTAIPPTSTRERRRTKDKERSNRSATSKITKAVEDFFYSGTVDGIKVAPDHSPSPRGAVTPPLRGRRIGRGGGPLRGSRPPSGDLPSGDSREALRKKKKAAMQQRSFDREYKMQDHAQSNSLDIDPLMMSYPTMRGSDMRTANGARSSQLDISVDSTEHYQSLSLQPVVKIGAGISHVIEAGAESICSSSLNLASFRRRNSNFAKPPTRHNSFQAGSLRAGTFRGLRIPSEVARCPQERIDFFRNMSTLIQNFGKKSGKGEEKEVPTVRQVSSEEQVYQARLHDLLWLELLAWRYGLSMKALDEALIQSRECFVPDVLSDILDFEYVPSHTLLQALPRERTLENLGASAESFGSPCQNFSASSHSVSASISSAHHRNFAASSPPPPPSSSASASASDACPPPNPRTAFAADSVPASPVLSPCSLYHDFDAESSPAVFSLHWAPSRYHVATQRDAIVKVRHLLERLQAAESLFPTTKAFGYFYDDYRSEKFNNHADALNLWLNLTTDLISKVQVMAKFLQLTEMPGLHLPWLDVALPEPNEQIDFLSQNLSQFMTFTDLKSDDGDDGRDDVGVSITAAAKKGKTDSSLAFPLDMDSNLDNGSQNVSNDESQPGISLTIPSDDDLDDDDDSAESEDDEDDDDDDRCKSVVINPLKVRFRSETSEISDESAAPLSSPPCISPSTISSPLDIPLSPPNLSPLTINSPERVNGVSILQSPPNVSTKDLKNPAYGNKNIIYRKFVDKSLKQMGLRKLMAKVLYVLQGTMEKIRVALEHPSEAESLMVPDHLFGAKSLSAEALEAYLGQIKHANSMSK